MEAQIAELKTGAARVSDLEQQLSAAVAEASRVPDLEERLLQANMQVRGSFMLI